MTSQQPCPKLASSFYFRHQASWVQDCSTPVGTILRRSHHCFCLQSSGLSTSEVARADLIANMTMGVNLILEIGRPKGGRRLGRFGLGRDPEKNDHKTEDTFSLDKSSRNKKPLTMKNIIVHYYESISGEIKFAKHCEKIIRFSFFIANNNFPPYTNQSQSQSKVPRFDLLTLADRVGSKIHRHPHRKDKKSPLK